MKYIFLLIMIITLGALGACSTGVSIGQETSDNIHTFTVKNAQIIDKIGDDIPPEKKDYFVMKYEVGNLQNQTDTPHQWPNQIKLVAAQERYEATRIVSLDKQLWETSLQPQERKEGYLVYLVPEDVHDFNLTLTFPESGKEVVFGIKATDKRIKANVDYILNSLEQIRRTRKIPVIGGVLVAVVSSPVRYMGVILVPVTEVPQLLVQIAGLPDDAQRKAIEDYLTARGLCRLE